MPKTLIIILKYSGVILIIRIINTIASATALGYLPQNINLLLIVILAVIVMSAIGYTCYQGTIELSKRIKNVRKLEYTGYLIPILALAIIALGEYMLLSEFGIAGPLLQLTAGATGTSIAVKEVKK